MTAPAAIQHVVEAFNLSAASENKIHDDIVAQRFGFAGGLVPGVEVYAYMTNPVVRQFGPDWLRRGGAECRFQKPVYDGRMATATGTVQGDGSLSLKVESEGVSCGTGRATFEPTTTGPAVEGYPTAPLPDHASRPDAAPESLVTGKIMGTFEQVMDRTELEKYLDDIREDLDLYRQEGIAHPGWLLRLANRALSMNVKLGPWIHVGSKVRNFDVARYGDSVAARARVSREYEHKGHRFVDLDVLLVANGSTAVAHIDHTAIYRPRQVAEAAE